MQSPKDLKKGGKSKNSIYVRIAVSVCAAVLLVVHRLYPSALPDDRIGIGLIVIGLLPWLLAVVSEAELPGGWKFRFREFEKEQQRQADEIESIKFLIARFVTEFELEHLMKINAPEPFWIDCNSGTNKKFGMELHHLLDLGLLVRVPDKGGVGTLLSEKGAVQRSGKLMKDVREYLRITEAGSDYLRMRTEMTAAGE